MRALLIALILVVGCGESGHTVRVVYDLDGAFFDAPFPIPHRQRADGTVDVADFPNERGSVIAGEYLAAVDRFSEGFGRNTGAWFRFDGAIDPTSVPDAVEPEAAMTAPVYVVDIDPLSPEQGQTVPITVQLKVGAETYSPANLLVLVPVQGWVLRPNTLYAAVVTTQLRDLQGASIGRAPLIADLAADRRPEGERDQQLADALAPLWPLLDAAGVDRATVAAATAYRTGDFTERTHALASAVRARAAPTATNVRVIQDEVDFVVLEGDVQVPLYQVGDKPYDDAGHIVFDNGVPVEQSTETVRFSLSLPKGSPMPAGGFPLLLYSAGQGGSYLQVVDRGEQDVNDDGDGPAKYLARRGIASFGVEANLTGPRHPSGSTAGVDFFNVQNAVALLDNHRQAVAELALFVELMGSISIAPGLVPGVDAAGASAITLDDTQFYQWGHSTGSLITAMSYAVHPTLRGGVLSGSGGSWLYNLTIKQTPAIPVVVAGVLGLAIDDAPDRFDPILNLVATLWEPIEPMNYAAQWSSTEHGRADPASVLLIAGVVDTYFLPPMYASLAVAAGMDVVGPLVETDILTDLARVGRGLVSAPATANRGAATQLLVQHPALAGSDGHFAPFEVEEARYHYACFLASAVAGAPTVYPAQSNGLAPCP